MTAGEVDNASRVDEYCEPSTVQVDHDDSSSLTVY